MNSAADKAFITTQIHALSVPLASTTLPPPLLQALNASLSHSLKLKLSSSSVRKTLDQLQGLREREVRRRERRDDREREGRVAVRKQILGGERGAWFEELPKKWPVAEEQHVDEEQLERYAELLKRVKTLRKQRARARQQVAHYQHLHSLASTINPDMIQKHALGNPESAIRVALGETADLLPGVVEEVEADSRELVALKRKRREAQGGGFRRGTGRALKEGSAAGAVLIEMLEH